MNKSNKSDEYTITLDSGETLDLSDIVDTTGDIVIDINDYNMNTTWVAPDSSFTIGPSDTINTSYTLDTTSNDWISGITIHDTRISPEEIEKMCEHYPGLEKVWRNFKSVYDMCKQDFEGKKKAGEIDDDIPF